jgi:leucyl-tRNA synthetase
LSANLIIEVDGEVHEYQVEKDKERDQIMVEKGLKVFRIKNEEIKKDISG